VLDEKSSNGRGYLAEICRDWETAALTARTAASRVVLIRNGVVLSSRGGALPEMLRPFNMGVGGRIGDGRQWLSWIDLDDAVRAIQFIIAHPELTGAVNLVAPTPVTNREFTATVSDVMKKPALVPVPAMALRLIFGEMAKETILASQRAIPSVLNSAGFEFSRPTIRESLMASRAQGN